jgi:hypothetical protein
MTEQTPALPPVKVAFVIDGTVVDVLHTDERLGSIFLSEPVIVDVTAADMPGGVKARPGDLYDAETGEFTAVPQPEPTEGQN